MKKYAEVQNYLPHTIAMGSLIFPPILKGRYNFHKQVFMKFQIFHSRHIPTLESQEVAAVPKNGGFTKNIYAVQ